MAAGVLAPDQLDEGLRAQVLHGARLGTNLVEMGHVELDQVAVALARRHGMPPAMRRHFERCDPDVQERLPAALAARHLCVPVGFLAGDADRVMIAVRDPLPSAARHELEAALGLKVVPAICAELRVLYFLERVYGVGRPNRFLRVRRRTTSGGGYGERRATTGSEGPVGSARAVTDAGFDGETWGAAALPAGEYPDTDGPTGQFRPVEPTDDALDDVDVALDFDSFEPPEGFHIEETPVEHILEPPPPGTLRRPTPALGEPASPSEPPLPPELSPARTERPLPDSESARRFVSTLADAPALGTLGRIALRKVELKTSSSGEIAEAADIARAFAAGATIEDVARAIRRAQSRGRVGELATGALRRFGDGVDAAVLFVVRETVASGWKGFSVDTDDLGLEELAVPLDQPNVLASAAHERRALVIDGHHGTALDRRLWAALAHPTPGQVAVAPVIVADAVVCLVYGQSAPGTPMTPHAQLFAAVTQATASAFGRLLRATQR